MTGPVQDTTQSLVATPMSPSHTLVRALRATGYALPPPVGDVVCVPAWAAKVWHVMPYGEDLIVIELCLHSEDFRQAVLFLMDEGTRHMMRKQDVQDRVRTLARPHLNNSPSYRRRVDLGGGFAW